jgi:hypothetical protein
MSVIVTGIFTLLLLYIFTFPAKGLIRFFADFISENMNHVPFLEGFVKSGSAIIKVDRNIANIAEQKRAIRAKWLLSGIITGIIFYPLLGYIIFWVCCVLLGSDQD